MRLLGMLFAVVLSAACAPQPVEMDGPPPAAANPDAGSIFTDPSAFDGQTVELEAAFQGYRVDDCRFAPTARPVSLTRSDWLIRRDAHCLYVTGGRMPLSLDRVGQTLHLKVQVTRDEEGKFLLRMIEARGVE